MLAATATAAFVLLLAAAACSLRRHHGRRSRQRVPPDRLDDRVQGGPARAGTRGSAALRVYLRQGDVERALPATDDLGRDREIERYRYETADQSVRLTSRACDAVIDGGAAIVVRHERPGLTQ